MDYPDSYGFGFEQFGIGFMIHGASFVYPKIEGFRLEFFVRFFRALINVKIYSLLFVVVRKLSESILLVLNKK